MNLNHLLNALPNCHFNKKYGFFFATWHDVIGRPDYGVITTISYVCKKMLAMCSCSFYWKEILSTSIEYLFYKMNRFHTSRSSGPPLMTQNSFCVHRDLTVGPLRTQNSFCILGWSSSSILFLILRSYSSKASGPPTTQKVPFCLLSADTMNLLSSFFGFAFCSGNCVGGPGSIDRGCRKNSIC